MKRLVVLFVSLLCAASVWGAVNINSASQQELETLVGIGPAKARAIIAYRQQHGPFKSVQDLGKVPGFGEKTVKKLEPDVRVSGPTEVKSTK